MNKYQHALFGLASKVEARHLQIVLILLTLSLVVIGAGAPIDGGGGIPPGGN
jgi:hypothetical protein